MVRDKQVSRFSRRSVIAFSFALRAVSPKLIGDSFVMEIDINKEVYALGWSTGTCLFKRKVSLYSLFTAFGGSSCQNNRFAPKVRRDLCGTESVILGPLSL